MEVNRDGPKDQAIKYTKFKGEEDKQEKKLKEVSWWVLVMCWL